MQSIAPTAAPPAASSARAAPRSHAPLLVGVLFLFSGAAALIYQVAWQRLLVVFAGGDVQAVTIIVAAFMLGLGLGHLAAGLLADRASRLRNLVFFGAAEAAIAFFGAASKHLYYDGLYQQLGGVAGSRPLTTLVLVASLLLPTMLMGLSLPLLARALVGRLGDAARGIGQLYGLNTFGAALGAFLATWVLLPNLGIEGSLRIAAALNALCALAVVPLAPMLRRETSVEARAASASLPVASRERRWSLGACLAIYGLAGFLALALEIVWFRLLGVMLKSTAFTFGTLLAIYLAGVGLGALVGTRLAPRSARPMMTFLLLQAGIGVLAVAIPTALLAVADGWPALAAWRSYFDSYEPIDANTAIALLRAWSTGAASPEDAVGAWLFPALHFGLPLLVVGPPTLLMGLSFPFLQKAVQTDFATLGRRVGWMQCANIAGSMVGTVAVSLWALPQLGTALTLQALAALGTALGFVAVLRSPALAARAWPVVAAPALIVGGLALAPDQRTLWARVHGTEPERIVVAEDGAGVSLLKTPPGAGAATTVFVNGIGQSWIPYGGIHSVLGALPALLHPAPEEIAIIGLGSGDTLYSAGLRPETRRLVCIEIVGAQLETLRSHARVTPYPALRALLDDPRIEHRAGDGRLHLMSSGRRYDIIEADALRPTSAHSGNLYSEEYFRLVASRLKPGGYAVTWCPTQRIHDTFVRVFPHVLSFGVLIIGSSEAIEISAEALERRLGDPAIRAYLRHAGLDPAALLGPFLGTDARRIVIGPEHDRSGLRDVNTDVFPRDEFALPALWGP
jgi:spermidine synthase